MRLPRALGHDPSGTPVAVVFGGPSAEHDVSVVSGNAIADALAGAGYPVSRNLIDLAGGWWSLPADHRRDDRPPAAYDDPAALGAQGPVPGGRALAGLAGGDPRTVVFLALHGPFGEDGTVQALVETAGLAYTGSGVTASAVGMDKAIFKRLVRGLGLPVVDWREIPEGRWRREPDAVLAELSAFAGATGDERLMIKPARLGSSVGMTLAHGPDERADALALAFRYDDLALAERYLAGARDLEVSVIGNAGDPLELYGPGEILAGHEFYDFAAKYVPGLSETTVGAEVSERERVTLLKLARDAYRAIGADGFARVDFLLAGETLVVSEINTIPGFTPISLFPAMAAAGGYDFTGVCARIVDLALARHEARRRPALTTADLYRDAS
ncbi:MAG TPA: D-alanine--D-alanine ligase [Candidatus Limnocylindrales bacterium]|nr:D-alanine--D-alanine ligase [Candidatus Limnocylindrales bacterium]